MLLACWGYGCAGRALAGSQNCKLSFLLLFLHISHANQEQLSVANILFRDHPAIESESHAMHVRMPLIFFR